MASSLKREIVFQMLQFLDEENFKNTLHMLEQESGLYFNMKYFEEKVLAGEWDDVEKYLSGFTNLHDNRHSMTMHYEIRLQKYLEALDRQDKGKAIEILMNELEVFSQYYKDMYEYLTQMLALNNIRQSVRFSDYRDIKTERSRLLINLKRLIGDNLLFAGKLSFPILEPNSLLNQSLKCSLNPRPNPLTDPVPYKMITIPGDESAANKIIQLLYTNKGFGLLALGSNGILKLWKMDRSEQNPSVEVRLWKPKSGRVMKNNVCHINLEQANPCLALTGNDSYVVSAIGGEASVFSMETFEVMTTIMAPPPACTFLAFHPRHNNIMAIGTEDSIIIVYNIELDKVISKLRGHHKRVTGLAFSTRLDVLISSGADAQLCEWNTDSWIKEKTVPLPQPAETASSCDTRVQFNSDMVRVLVSSEYQLAIYDSYKTLLLQQWVPQRDLSAPISSTAYSCDSVYVYASFCDGNVGIFDGDTLTPIWHIPSTVYLSQAGLNQSVYPLVMATSPHDKDLFAIGLSDGSVKVFVRKSERSWRLANSCSNLFGINQQP